jgi:beta-N-acetylglucosaminidase
MTLRPSSHHVNTTLNKGNTMPTFEQTRQRLEQVLQSNRAIMNTIAIELGEAMRLHDFMRNDQTRAKVKEIEKTYNMAWEKVDTINSVYRQFLKDGIAPEWL